MMWWIWTWPRYSEDIPPYQKLTFVPGRGIWTGKCKHDTQRCLFCSHDLDIQIWPENSGQMSCHAMSNVWTTTTKYQSVLLLLLNVLMTCNMSTSDRWIVGAGRGRSCGGLVKCKWAKMNENENKTMTYFKRSQVVKRTNNTCDNLISLCPTSGNVNYCRTGHLRCRWYLLPQKASWKCAKYDTTLRLQYVIKPTSALQNLAWKVLILRYFKVDSLAWLYLHVATQITLTMVTVIKNPHYSTPPPSAPWNCLAAIMKTFYLQGRQRRVYN